jgi:hypothetical protein
MQFSGAATLDARLAATGTLTLAATRLLTTLPATAELPFTPASLTVNGHEGTVVLSGTGTTLPETSPAMAPGRIAVSAGQVRLDGVHLALPGGTIDLHATAADGDLAILGTSFLDTAGGLFSFLPSPGAGVAAPAFVLHGGDISLRADQGDIQVDSAATIDLSDPAGGQAGTLALSAAKGEIGLNGAVHGAGGGSLAMDTLALDDFGALNQKLGANGFDKSIALRLRSGDLLVGQGQVVTARAIDLAVDQGAVTINGVLRANGAAGGGTIAIHAGGAVSLAGSSALEAKGTGPDAAGGEVELSSATGAITTEAGSTIDVSGTGTGGSTTFRVQRQGSKLPLSLAGEVLGSKRTAVQAAKTYTDSAITATDLTSWQADADAFMAQVAPIPGVVIVPEIEVRSTGAMTLQSGLNTLATWRSGGIPGVLTFRSGGDLKVETSVVDVPTLLDTTISYSRLIQVDGKVDSCGLNFVAGADFTAADVMATGQTGNLTFGKTGAAVTVYTESAPIRFASAGTTTVNSPGTTPRDYMPGVQVYTLATFDNSIQGRTGGDLNLSTGGVIQSATGAITLTSGGEVKLGASGAIRTTGRAPEWAESPQWLAVYAAMDPQPTRLKAGNLLRLMRYWDYRDGGSITITAQEEISGTINTGVGTGWDKANQETVFTNLPDSTQSVKVNHLSANYGGKDATTGVAAMAGGDVQLTAQGAIRGQAAVFGAGTLSVAAGGDVDGRFLASAGDLQISTHGSFGRLDGDLPIETGGGHLSLQALGSVALGVIDNPDLFNSYIDAIGLGYRLGYTSDSRAQVIAVTGDVTFSGETPLYNGILGQEPRGRVLPPSLSIAAGRDLALMRDDWLLAPSPHGSLQLMAGRDINGAFASATPGKWTQGALIMSDANPLAYLGSQVAANAGAGGNLVDNMRFEHQGTVLHQEDGQSIVIHAGRDLANLSLILPKKARIRADHDIRNMQFIGQNIEEEDCSAIMAGHDLSLAQPVGFEGGYRSLQLGGPGFFLVEAGNNMDLGVTTSSALFDIISYGGIVTYGSAFNPALHSGNSAQGRPKGSDIAVIAGYAMEPGPDALDQFVASLREEEKKFSELQNTGDIAGAAAIKDEFRSGLMATFLGKNRSGEGLLNMTSSTINSKSGEDAIAIIAAGEVNVGVSTINTAPVEEGVTKESGIFTTSGGGITIVADGNINVNESRVMSFLGGDIILLSDHGNINAGRGSKTTFIAAPPRVVTTWNNNNTPDDLSDDFEERRTVFDPPATGSGLRALAYDPDASGPLLPPEPGDMYVVAWDGVVDAGEAGIAGGKLFLAATQVLNAQNINVGVGSVGMPAAAGAPAGLSALAGNSATTTAGTTTGIAKETTANTSTTAEQMAQTAKKIAEAMNQLRFFVVKFMGFMGSEAIAAEAPETGTKQEADKKKR